MSDPWEPLPEEIKLHLRAEGVTSSKALFEYFKHIPPGAHPVDCVKGSFGLKTGQAIEVVRLFHAAGAVAGGYTFFKDLLPELKSVPNVSELKTFVGLPAAKPVPLLVDAYKHISRYPVAECFAVSEEAAVEHIVFSSVIVHDFTFNGEVDTASAVDAVFCWPLLFMDRHRFGIRLDKFRDQGDTESSTTTLADKAKALRPDLQLRAGSDVRLLLKGEEKRYGIPVSAAVADLQKKMKVWSPLYYGSMPFLLCYAAAGSTLQFYAVPRGETTPRPISKEYDMARPEGRAEILLATMQVYRILAAIWHSLAEHVLPLGHINEHVCLFEEGAITRTLEFQPDLSAVKSIAPFSIFARAYHTSFKQIEEVFVAARKGPGVVSAREGPQLALKRQVYSVKMEPVGLHKEDAIPQTEAQLRAAVHGLLHGLKTLHEAGKVHRDPRFSNVACDINKEHWFWIDLELAGPDGEDPGFRLTTWPDGVLDSGSRYTCRSDLFCLGHMVSQLDVCDRVDDVAGAEVLRALQSPVADQTRSAADFLKLAWFQCGGEGCMVPGAQPDQR